MKTVSPNTLRRYARLAAAVVPLLAALTGSSLQAAAPMPAGWQQDDRNAPGAPHETAIEVGSPPPTWFALPSLDGDVHDLGEIDRPILLLFFRGTW